MMLDTTASAKPDTKSFSGNYLLWRKSGQKLRKGMPGGAGNPRFRHASFAAAEIEAMRLLGLFPKSSFVILQEVARVKLKDAGQEPPRPTDRDPAHVFDAHTRWVQSQEAMQ